MLWLVLGIAVLALLVLPNIWVKSVLAKYSKERNDLSGTGGELAQHLITGFKLPIKLEQSELPDRYDPSTKTVYLTKHSMNAKSLTAIATAVHEVGHAIQDTRNDSRLKNRTRLIMFSIGIERIAQLAFICLPIISFIPGGAAIGRILFIPIILSMLMNTLVHLVTLPVELDASFNKALPILEEGGYLQGEDLKSARVILKACALTYVSSAALSVLNLGRWIRMFRR